MKTHVPIYLKKQIFCIHVKLVQSKGNSIIIVIHLTYEKIILTQLSI